MNLEKRLQGLETVDQQLTKLPGLALKAMGLEGGSEALGYLWFQCSSSLLCVTAGFLRLSLFLFQIPLIIGWF